MRCKQLSYTNDSCQRFITKKEVNLMKTTNNKKNSITIRLNNNELGIVNINSRDLNLSKSEYIRSLITERKSVEVDYRKDIVPVLGNIYVKLQELGLEEENITKEVHKLCQMLS